MILRIKIEVQKMYETVLNYICLIGIVVAVIAYSILKDK